MRKSFGCGEHIEIASGNSDAKCHRIKPSRAIAFVTKNPGVCEGCVYNHQRFRTPPNQSWPLTKSLE